MWIKTFKFSILLFFIINMAGCAGYQTKLDCPHKPGVTCKSALEIRSTIENNLKNKTNITSVQSGGHRVYCSEGGKVRRSPERTLEVWIASFVDEGGNYHAPSIVNAIVSPGRWEAVGV